MLPRISKLKIKAQKRLYENLTPGFFVAAGARGFPLPPRTSRAEQKNFNGYGGNYQNHYFFDLKPTLTNNDFIDKNKVLYTYLLGDFHLKINIPSGLETTPN